MPSSTSSSEARRWLAVFGACVAVVAALLGLTLRTPPAYGDLTRVGALSERAFGWRAPQPALAPALLVSAALAQADVLVVGDSFSIEPGRHPRAGLAWQSRLVEAGLRVATLHWDRARPLCNDFPAWLQAQGFHGRWVLLQTVERMVDARLADTARCTRAATADTRLQAKPPPVAPPPPALNTGERLLTGIGTWWNTRRALQAADGQVFRGPGADASTRVHRVADGCRRFSHAACERVLFLAEDETLPRLAPHHAAAMARLAHRPAPWRTAWVAVPNKTSVYLDPAPTAAATRALAQAGAGPDLLAALRHAAQQADAAPDLYFPNDTHLSPRGARQLGEAVLAWLRAQDPAPPPRPS